jgi:hypothetical protein
MKTSYAAVVAVPLAFTLGAVQAAGPAQPANNAASAAAAVSTARKVEPAASSTVRPASGLRGMENAQRRADGALVIGGTLAGSGTVSGTGTRVITGKVAPGNSPGCVSDEGNVVFEGSATLEIEIGGITPCTQFDQYSVALTLTLNGPTLNLLLINGFVPSAGQRFRVLRWGTLVGSFGKVNVPALPAGLSWDTSGLYTVGELAVAGPIDNGEAPLPVWSLGMLGAGLVAVLARRRR